MPAVWAAGYIGIPYRQNGHTHDGADCYGLCCLVLAEQFGITLPLSCGRGSRADDLRAADALRPIIPSVQVHQVEAIPGDLVLMNIAGAPAHIGVYVGDGLILHVSEGHESCLERMSGPRLARRIEGMYRVQSQPAEEPVQAQP